MRIIELNITNYRGFKEKTTFSFSKNLTVFAGVNGKGKTSVIEAIGLILSRLLPHISPARSGYRNINPLDIHEGEREATISIKLNCAGIPLVYSLSYNIERRKIELTKLPLAVRDEIKRAYGNPQRADDQAPLVVYYTTDRAGYRFPKAVVRATGGGQSMAYNGALLNRTVSYKDFLSRFIVYSQPTGIADTWRTNTLEAINNAVRELLDGFSDLQVEQGPPRLMVWKEESLLDLRQLSDGERSLIAMVSDLGRRLALANPELENPLLGAGVVLIDELELHLHPKWQIEVTEKLRTIFPNIQFIVTTHSPFILQNARQGEVISLDGELAVEPFGKSLEEVARYVMEVENTEYSPRIKQMRETAREYLRLAEEARTATRPRKREIQAQLANLLAPFTDNPAYTALLESKGMIEPET